MWEATHSISWTCKKRAAVSHSSTEAEIIPRHAGILPNAHISSQRASLFVFEDNDAVIKMTIKGRSPFMRHISRTHHVNLDPLFDRMNLDLAIQIKDVNTSKQMADILTKGSFSRERWSQLTQFFNLTTPHVHLNSHSSALFTFLQKTHKMSKREAEPITESATAKQRPVRNHCADDLHSASSSSSSLSPRRNTAEQDANSVDSTCMCRKRHSEKT